MTHSHSRPWRAGILTLALAAVGATAHATLAQKGVAEQKPLTDRELSNVAKQFGEFVDARAANKGSYEAQEALEKEMAKAAKKLGGDGKDLEPLLAHPWSMSRAVWLSADYDAKASKQRKELGKVTEQTGEKDIKFALWVPGKYKPKDGPYPLLISIPDEGKKAEQHIMEEWVEPDIRDNFVIASPIMPGNGGEWLERDGIATVMFTLKRIREEFAIDFDRVFIGGRGRGVETAHAIAGRFPDQFAGVFGWGGDAHKDVPVDTFRNIATYFAGGGPIATAFEKEAKALGYSNVVLNPTGTGTDIATWALNTRRNPYPEIVTILQTKGSPTNGYWVSIPPVDAERVRIEAKVDRASNTFTIEAEGVTSATLLLNDALVDLSKPITVIANGEETKFSEGRKMSLSLDLFMRGRNDGGRYFVASREVRLPLRAAKEDAAAGGDAGQGAASGSGD